MKKLVIVWVILWGLVLWGCSNNEKIEVSKTDSKVVIWENNQDLNTWDKEILIENKDNSWKKLKVNLLKTETLQEYKDNFWEIIKSEWIQIITLQIENIWKEPYDLNSWLGITSWWIQLENNWIKYNIHSYNDTASTVNWWNPWEKWEATYIVNTNNTKLINWKLIFKKTTIKEEKILDLN